ncbi:MAG: hypothetical protein AAF629_15090 [Chloroflexota bacterium]
MSVIVALGQFFFKLAATQNDSDQLVGLFLNWPVWVGIVIYIGSVPIVIWAYKLWPLSKAFPMVSLSLVWSLLLAVIFFAEVITPLRLVGALLIVVGTLIVGQES